MGDPVNALDQATAGEEIVELYDAWLLSSFHVNVHIVGQHNGFGVRGQTIEYPGELVEEHWTDRAGAVDSSNKSGCLTDRDLCGDDLERNGRWADLDGDEANAAGGDDGYAAMISSERLLGAPSAGTGAFDDTETFSAQVLDRHRDGEKALSSGIIIGHINCV